MGGAPDISTEENYKVESNDPRANAIKKEEAPFHEMTEREKVAKGRKNLGTLAAMVIQKTGYSKGSGPNTPT